MEGGGTHKNTTLQITNICYYERRLISDSYSVFK